MRVTTAKRLGILVFVVILVGVTGFFTQRYQLNRLAEKELEKAELAYEEGDFARAESLLRFQRRVLPADEKLKVRHADAIVKASGSLMAQSEAELLYAQFLNRFSGREDVRLSLIKLKFEMGRLVSGPGREDGADVHVKILVDKDYLKDDTHLSYLMGRCQEAKEIYTTPVRNTEEPKQSDQDRVTQDRVTPGAVDWYGKVVNQKAVDRISAKMTRLTPSEKEALPKSVVKQAADDRIDAGKRLATLLLDKLKKTEEAKAVMNKLVEDAKEDYRGYLARGRFRLERARDNSQKALVPKAKAQEAREKGLEREAKTLEREVNALETEAKALEAGAKKDFDKALELASDAPEVYLEQAQNYLSEGESGYEKARKQLKDGLKNVPTSKEIYEALANAELRAGNGNGAIEVLELGVQGIELKLLPKLEQVNCIVVKGSISASFLKALPVLEYVRGMPVQGKNLIVVGMVKNVLHIRVFDVEGNMVTDADEGKLAAKAETVTAKTVDKLKKRLESLRASEAQELTKRKEELTKRNRDLIIADVASIVNSRGTGELNQVDQSSLRFHLAELLARSGHTGKLQLQIEELSKAGYPQILINYFNACLYINSKQFLKAQKILVTIQPVMNRSLSAVWKSKVNLLLAQCYGELGEPEMQQGAILAARSANPQDMPARESWIRNLISQGDTEGAIKELRAFVKEDPRLRATLAHLLIEQNQRRPKAQQDWSEVEELIKKVGEKDAQSAERAVLLSELLVAQGKPEGAREELEKAKSRFPKNAEIRVRQAIIVASQGRLEEAFGLLDQAEKQLGDSVDLRLGLARIWALKKGPEVLEALTGLSQGLETFSKGDQKRLLNELASEFWRQQDLEGASRLWKQLATQDPGNIGLRLNLLDLALHNSTKDEIEKTKGEIEKNIKEIEEIEGNEGLLGRYCQVRYLIWQAKQAKDKESRRAIQDRAHRLLEDLVSRRGDWSVIPLAFAELAEQELAQSDLSDDEIQAKEESIINYYLQAINLGQRRAAIVDRTVKLLFKNKQVDRAVELLGTIPMQSQLAGVQQQAAQLAIENRDFQHALQIARKAVQANPGDFKERVWLAQILFASDQRDQAIKEIRDAVNLAPDDPDRWVALVTFMIIAKEKTGVEAVIKEAETKLPPSKAPFALALCCERMGRDYDGTNEAERTRWNSAAKSWYEKAQAVEPAELSIKRRFADFLLKSRQIGEAQKYLEVIGKQVGGAWANRALALILANGSDRAQRSRALTIFEPDGKPVPAGEEGKILERKNAADAEDLRVLAQVLDLQGTGVHRKRAIEILETLADKNRATPNDRFMIARLYEAIGELKKAREKYFDLSFRTRQARDPETFNRRPFYLAQLARNLLRDCKPSDKAQLAEAQEVIDEIKQIQPAALGTLALQVEIHHIRNEDEQAAELIRAYTSNPRLGPDDIAKAADLAQQIKQIPLAEELFRRLGDLPNSVRGKLRLAAFLGSQNRVAEALKICEPLWSSNEPELVGTVCVEILFGSGHHTHAAEAGDIDRVSNWFQQAIDQAQNQHLPIQRLLILLTGLGNLRERQERFSEAEILYQRVIQSGESVGVALNNLAWLLAMSPDPKRIKQALDCANQAVALTPEQPEFLDTRGMVYLVSGQPKAAIADLEHAVSLDPSSAVKYFHLAQAYHASGDKVQARVKLNRAMDLKLSPDSGQLHRLEQRNYQKVLNTLGSP